MSERENKGKRCVIVGGAKIGDYLRIKNLLKQDDFMIFCDSGLRHMEGLGRKPDLIVGDFDSSENPKMDVKTIVLPTVKDDTDTFYGAKEALKMGFDDFLLIGAVGGRFDHSMANISILLYLDDNKKNAEIADDYSRMRIISDDVFEVDPEYRFFSLLAVDGDVTGLDIRDAKYELSDASLSAGYQYAVSNETIPGKSAKVSIKNGRLLLVLVEGEEAVTVQNSDQKQAV